MAAAGMAIQQELVPGMRIGFQGDLGAGKTTLVKHIAEAFGIAATLVVSPSYTIMHEYPIPGERFTIQHWDLYRLQHCPDELYDPYTNAIHLIEWPEVDEELVQSLNRLYCIKFQGEGRLIEAYQATT